jgi:hypothetical protein
MSWCHMFQANVKRAAPLAYHPPRAIKIGNDRPRSPKVSYYTERPADLGTSVVFLPTRIAHMDHLLPCY